MMSKIFRGVMILALVISPIMSLSVHAQMISVDEEVFFENNVRLVLTAGSNVASVTSTPTTMTLSIPMGGSVGVKWQGPNTGLLLNNVGNVSCKNNGGSNVVTFAGPLQVTIIPDPFSICTSNGDQIVGGGAMSVAVQSPRGGMYKAGDMIPVQWSTSTNLGLHHIRISLEHGGVSVVLAGNEENDGFAQVVAPTITGDVMAVIKVEAIAYNGTVYAVANSQPAFVLDGPEPVVVPPPTPAVPALPTGLSGLFEVPTVMLGTVTIDMDKSIPAVSGGLCAGGSLIKGSTAAVYYCGADGKRYVFPNQATYFSWYADFSGVQKIADSALAQIVVGGNVTIKPAVKMVKTPSDPNVYVVARGGVLRLVPSEAVAVVLYGASWAQFVVDVPEAFFVNYSLGTPLSGV